MIKYKVKSGREDATKATASDWFKNLKGAKGFLSAVIYSDEATNEWG